MTNTPKNINICGLFTLLLLLLPASLFAAQGGQELQRLDVFEVQVEEAGESEALAAFPPASEFYLHTPAPEVEPVPRDPELDLWMLQRLAEDNTTPAGTEPRREGE